MEKRKSRRSAQGVIGAASALLLAVALAACSASGNGGKAEGRFR